MNIESISTASNPARVSQPETAQKVKSDSKPSEPTKFAPLAKTRSPAENQNQKGESNFSVTEAVKRLEEFVAPTQSQISFSIDEELGVSVVKILDTQSKEVIRQFPSEEAINLARALDKLQGLLIRDKA